MNELLQISDSIGSLKTDIAAARGDMRTEFATIGGRLDGLDIHITALQTETKSVRDSVSNIATDVEGLKGWRMWLIGVAAGAAFLAALALWVIDFASKIKAS